MNHIAKLNDIEIRALSNLYNQYMMQHKILILPLKENMNKEELQLLKQEHAAKYKELIHQACEFARTNVQVEIDYYDRRSNVAQMSVDEIILAGFKTRHDYLQKLADDRQNSLQGI